MSEWLRRQTRNLLGLPAQVRILPTTLFYFIYYSIYSAPFITSHVKIMLLNNIKSFNSLRKICTAQSYQMFSQSKRKVVLFPGNGIGPEISQSVINIFEAAKVPIEFEHHQIHTKGQTQDGDLISYESISRVQ